MSPWPLFQELALALALAFFLGLTFEDFYARVGERRPGGIRTFPMLALAGALLYIIDRERLLLLAAGLLCIGTWLAIYYLRRTGEKDAEGAASYGLMVPVCNVIAFLLGPVVMVAPVWVPCGVTAAAVLFLTAREQLHRIARDIELRELVTAGKFLVLSGLILPLLPDRQVTGLTAITPRQAWIALIAVSGISYVSYLLQRYVRPKAAGLFVAVLGGLYSSTATTIALARQARTSSAGLGEARAGIFIATALMYLRVLTIVALFNGRLALSLAPAFAPLLALAGALALVGHRSGTGASNGEHATSSPTNPLGLSTAFMFAGIFVVTSLITTYARNTFGVQGLYTLAGFIGFTEIDPFILNLSASGDALVTQHVAITAILITVSANNVLKAIYAGAVGGRALGATPSVGLIALAVAGFAIARYFA